MSMQPEPASKGQLPIDPLVARDRLKSATGMHAYHWLIILLSALLSVVAWRYSKSTLDGKIQARFDRESEHVVELIQERMSKYEDALWGGVASIDAAGGDVTFDHWRRYAQSIHIEKKYPGINGMGVIHAIENELLADYLTEQRLNRPDFNVHPPHDRNVNYPITYIVPFKGNEKAVGLDIAHESSRYAAAKMARDSGDARITGPIALVQDNSNTPGFLFYAPFYQDGRTGDLAKRQQTFTGLVYAPFVVKKLMQGALEKEKRHVGLRLMDGNDVIYDEHIETEPDFDPDPMCRMTTTLEVYGRNWTFDIWSANSFRAASTSSQPLFILIGGILIDVLLVILFVSISRSSKKALGYADAMTRQLEINTSELKRTQAEAINRATQLEQSNSELEQFACIASHDLQEPLRKVATFCELLQDEYGDQIDEDGREYIRFAIDGSKRMRALVQDLMAFSRIGSMDDEQPSEEVYSLMCFESALLNLESAIEESRAIITHDELPTIVVEERHLGQMLQNLIGNSIKYRGNNRPEIHVSVESSPAEWVFSVSDNGIGIPVEYHSRIFGIFKRLHNRSEYEGTGIGLAICQRIVDRWNGRIWIDPHQEIGCMIRFSIPKELCPHRFEKEPGLVTSAT